MISGSSPGAPAAREQSVNVNLTVRVPAAARGPADSRTSFPAAPRSLWRFRRLLPLPDAEPVSLGEGATPLVPLERLGRRLGVPQPLRQGREPEPDLVLQGPALLARGDPRGGHRGAGDHDLVDRQSRRVHRGLRGARGPAVRHLHARLGAGHHEDADAVLRRGGGGLRHLRAALDADARGHRARGLVSRPAAGWCRRSARTRSGSRATRPSPTRSRRISAGPLPTWSRCRAATATGSSGSGRAGSSCERLGLVKTRPRMLAAEPFGPLAHALERKLETPEKVVAGSSVAFSIASPYGTYQGLTALRDSDGLGVPITDEGIFEAQRALASEEGLYAEPSALVGLTAVMQQARAGRLAARSACRRGADLGRAQGLRGEPRVAARRAGGGPRLRPSTLQALEAQLWTSAPDLASARRSRARARPATWSSAPAPPSGPASTASGSSRTTSRPAPSRWPAPPPR